MDNIKIEFLGYGAEVTIGQLNDLQSNYILAHQIECNTNVPILDQNNQLTYENWSSVNSHASFYGASYSSCQINILVNDEPYTLSNRVEVNDYVVKENNSNYLISIQHLNGIIFKYEFEVDNFDETKLVFLIKNIDSLFWGELIYGLEYDNNILTSIGEINVNYHFENILIKNNMVSPIQKI
jgi:hypothetical protein